MRWTMLRARRRARVERASPRVPRRRELRLVTSEAVLVAELAAALSAKLDVGVHCFTAVVDDTKWYRVRVGPYDNEELANTKKELIETLLGESGFIVSKAP